ncbi:hypothetical protein EK21DRAFT_78774 [Setomelanomma holmii]|uniref:Stress-response A/B barrel domain-containing protein n=1 Tax=Setomelanomma holmii TaxID=210430 RepID=A0A9P4LGJ1_9PLEO|nr:hypothetical protein EK21DRAFT_78774 [Setomelanomma holmii]
MPTIRRMVLFKIPSEVDQQKLLGMYKEMPTRALKNGKSYILSVEAGTTQQDSRAQGYTIAATSVFRDQEDFDYYDVDCKAHGELKAFARSVNEGMCMVRIVVD